jgi:hypothetical protein
MVNDCDLKRDKFYWAEVNDLSLKELNEVLWTYHDNRFSV